MKAIVTKDVLQSMLDREDPEYVKQVVGRALVVIYKNQTASEQHCNSTTDANGVGFTGFDARSGTLTAKSYLKHQTLQDWQVEKWTKKTKSGFARLCNYWKQINAAAEAKQVKGRWATAIVEQAIAE